MKDTIKRLTDGAARLLVLALGLGLATTGWADFQKTNPVTGETESYTWKFVGTDIWNGTGYWQDSSGANPSHVPAKSDDDTWDPILFDGNNINIAASMSVEGWNLRMGLYNGATVRLNNFRKLQGDTDMWMTVDATSSLTIGAFAGGNISDNKAIKLYVARANGITWAANLASSGTANNTFEYYLKDVGSVSYQAVSAANHKIKRADFTISGGSKSVQSKTLVSFTSSSKTFTADATIDVLSGGTVVATDMLVDVNTTGTTTLTTDDRVGACELVQTTTGVLLYYVDGPVYETKTYKPSINVNFTHDGAGLSTAADVGIREYAVPGTSWSNMSGANGSSSTIYGVDATGAASQVAGASVTVSGAYGSWSYSSAPGASDVRNGYIDDADGTATPQVLVEGIPYVAYKLVLYFSNDTNRRPFGHLTVNGTNYKWDDSNNRIVTCEGVEADCWGSSSGSNWTEGGNYLVFPTIINNADGELTIVGHRWSGSKRMGVAAIQIVEVDLGGAAVWANGSWASEPVAGGDAVIEVSGNTALAYDGTTEALENISVIGSGTLTISGAKLTATTLDVAPNVTLVMNSCVGATTVAGQGIVVYDGAVPATTTSFANDWTGTVWIKNVTHNGTGSGDGRDFDPNKYGNNNSKVKLTGVTCYLKYTVTTRPTIVLEDSGNTPALTVDNGYDSQSYFFRVLSGGGTLSGSGSGGSQQKLVVNGFSDFTGSIDAGVRSIFISAQTTASSAWGNAPEVVNRKGVIYVDSGASGTIDAAAKWTTAAAGSIVVAGNGELSFSNATSITNTVRGAGTLVRTGIASHGAVGTVLGLADSENWTGVFEFRNCNMGLWNAKDFGNSESTVRLNGTTSYLYTGSDKHTVKCIDIGSGGWTVDGGYSASTFEIPAKLTGSGDFTANTANAGNKTFQFAGDVSEYTGAMAFGNSAANTRIVIGATERAFTASSIVVGDGKSFTIAKSMSGTPGGGFFIDEGGQVTIADSAFVWTSAGFAVDGTLTVSSRANRIGGGTPIALGDNGILEITGNNADESSATYNGITGTGSIKYSGSGYLVLSSNYPTAIPLIDEKASALVVPAAGATIGSLSGTKGFRSDWGTTPDGGRYLTIKQAKDTEWSGSINQTGAHRLTGVVVDAGESTTGTLTMSATQTATATLAVNGSVNLTGTWVGDTTVAGTFGGTGTLTGALTMNNGATFKANSSALAVSGAVAFPTDDGESATVDLSGVTLDSAGVTLISGASSIGSVAKVSAAGAFLKVEGDGTKSLKAYPLVATYAGENYATMQEAITAAGDENLASITVVDGTAAVPAGYVVKEGAVYKAIASVTAADDSVTYHETVDAAYGAMQYAITWKGGYKYITILADMSLEPQQLVKYKIADGVVVTPLAASDEYGTPTQDTPDENGAFMYSFPTKATTYTWCGGGQTASWIIPGNWTYGAGTAAERYPIAGDSVIINTATSITVDGAGVAVNGITVGAAVTLTATTAKAVTASEDGIVLTTAGASITTSNVTLSPTPTTTVANSYVKWVDTTYSVDAYNTVAFTAPNATVTRIDALGTAIKDGDTITFTVSPDSGYAVTGVAVTSGSGEVTGSGPYSYTVTGDATITVTTVSTSITIGSGTISYFASYTNATVTAPVTGTVLDGTTFTLTGSGIAGTYTGTYSDGTVTFNNVHGYSLGDTLNYTIAASGASTGTSGRQSSTVGQSVTEDSGWMLWSKTQTTVGGWTDENGVEKTPDYGDETFAAFSGTNIYTAVGASAGDVVNVTTTIKFGDVADPSVGVGVDAQAAMKIGQVGDDCAFQLYTAGDWTSVYNDALGAPDVDKEYEVAVRIDYTGKTYSVKAREAEGAFYYSLTNASGSAAFSLANAEADALQTVQYMGVGSFVSLSGNYVSAGYTADIGTDGSATNVVVDSGFINDYMSDKLADEISDLLSPTNKTEAALAKNRVNNFFECYALGLDPTKEDDKVIVDVSTDQSGNFVFTVKHPVYDGETIVGYEPITEARNVQTSVKLKYGTSADSVDTEETSENEGTVGPADMFSKVGVGNVIYYKAVVTISAK